MRRDGQFILFENLEEFKVWLMNSSFSRYIYRIQHHHTYVPSYATWAQNHEHFSVLKGMDYYHETHRFSDIAQNITTFPDGAVAVCRPFDVMPAGIMGANDGAITIENIGNFDTEDMTEAQRSAIIVLTDLLCQKFNIYPNTDTIIYHHWFDLGTGERTDGKYGVTKTCPGLKFFGGNTVECAEKYFIPLVIGKQVEIPKGGEAQMILKIGDYSSAVGNLQEDLAKIGYQIIVDNDFGPATSFAVKDFQKASGLAADGVVGAMTREALDKAVAAKTNKAAEEDKLRVLQAKYDALLEKYNNLAGAVKGIASGL